MFALNRKVQNAVCMLLSALIVTAGLSLGAFAAERAAQNSYSVTVTQLS
ncbi:MAG: hypothetical protein ABW110_20875 [Steroidobacteraceae bacterium]